MYMYIKMCIICVYTCEPTLIVANVAPDHRGQAARGSGAFVVVCTVECSPLHSRHSHDIN